MLELKLNYVSKRGSRYDWNGRRENIGLSMNASEDGERTIATFRLCVPLKAFFGEVLFLPQTQLVVSNDKQR